MPSAIVRLKQWLLVPSYSVAELDQQRRIRMVTLLTTFHLSFIVLVAMQFLLQGDLPLPVVVQFALNGAILALMLMRQFQAGFVVLIGASVVSHFLVIPFSDLVNLLYVTTSFVVVCVLIQPRYRLPYAALTVALVLAVGVWTSQHPIYASVSHQNVVMFVVMAIISTTVATTIIDGDLAQIREQLATLRQSEMRYRLLAENINDMVTLYTPDLKLIYASPSYLRTTGFSEAELMTMPPEEFWGQIRFEDTLAGRDIAYHQIEGRSVATFQYQHERKDGTFFWAETFSVPIFDESGSIVQVVSSSRDITERIRMEKALRDSEKRAQALLRAIPDHVYRIRRDGTILDVGGSFADSQMIPAAERGQNIQQLDPTLNVPPHWIQQFLHTLHTTLDEQQLQTLEYQFDLPELGKQEFEARFVPSGSDEVISIIRNVTQRKRAEQALQVRTEYLTALHKISLELLHRRDMDDLLQAIVENASRILDAPFVKLMLVEDARTMVVRAFTPNQPFVKGDKTYRTENILSKKTWEAYDTHQPALIQDYAAYAQAHGGDVEVPLGAVANFPVIIGAACIGILGLARQQRDYPFSPEQIEFGQMFSQMTALVVDNITQYNAAVQEIAERQQVEHALRQSEARATALLNAIPDLVIQVSGDGLILDMGGNIGAAVYTPQQAIGKNVAELFHSTFQQRLRTTIQQTLATKQIQTMEYELAHPESGLLEFEARFVPSGDNEITIIIRDITHRRQLERELQDKHRQLKDAQRLTRLGSWQWEVSTNRLTYSDELFDILGIDPANFRGTYQEYLAIVHSSDRAEVNRIIENALQRGEDYAFYHRIQHPQRGERFIHSRGQVFRDAAKRVTHVIGTGQDVTDLKQAEQALAIRNEYLITLYEISLDVMQRRDLDDVLQALVNNAARILSASYADIKLVDGADFVFRAVTHNHLMAKGQRVGQQVGKLSWRAYHTQSPMMIDDYSTWEEQRMLFDTIPVHAIAEFPIIIGTTCIGLLGITRSQPNHPFSSEEVEIGQMFSRMAALIVDNVTQYNAALQEITERKAAENLQHQLTAELRAVNDELKDFAYVISHDLKAPLRGIHTIANWLLADYAHMLDTTGHELLRLLNKRVHRMEAMINGVLEYSRLGRKTVPKQIDLNQLVSQILDDLNPHQQHRVLIPHPLPTLSADPTHLHQVFQNLLDNAIKYMDKPQGEIRIDCEAQGDKWFFRIADNGPGIDARYFDKIFQIFQTLQPRDEFESTGIGLTIVKRIIESYGGEIWVESTLGSGSAFLFTLPLDTNRQ